MNEPNRNLVIRIASAAVALPVVLFLIDQGGIPLACLVGFAAAVLVFEVYGMALGALDPLQVLGIAVGAALPFAATLWPRTFPGVALGLLAALLILLLAFHVFSGSMERAPERTALALFGVIYGSLLLTSVIVLRQTPSGQKWLILTLVATWLNDTGAYAFGRLLGRTRMAPAISPSKTWEGFAGGLATSIAAVFIVKAVYFETLRLSDCFAVAIGASLLGPLGDLCESMIKRAYGAKDSGKILPGHGGLLDRVDALLFVAPFVLVYQQLR